MAQRASGFQGSRSGRGVYTGFIRDYKGLKLRVYKGLYGLRVYKGLEFRGFMGWGLGV